MADRLQRIEFCKSRDGTRIAFATCGQGPPIVWVSYSLRFPYRVTHLVLYGCHTRGPLVRGISEAEKLEAETRLKAIELGWLNQNAAFGQFFTALHAPDAPLDYVRSYSELLRTTT